MRLAVAFTGGKDSTLVVTGYQLLDSQQQHASLPEGLRARLLASLPDGVNVEVCTLVVFAPPGGVSSFKAHPIPVIEALAKCLQLPLIIKTINGPDYLASYVTAIKELATEQGIDALATGDILDVCSNFMGRAAEGAGMPLVRPLWGIPRSELLEYLWALKLAPIITCVNVHKFQPTATPQPPSSLETSSTAGAAAAQVAADGEACHGSNADSNGHYSCMQPREQPVVSTASKPSAAAEIDPVADVLAHSLTPEFHSRVLVPASAALGVDECGEHGEYHTMCLDGPTFKARLAVVYDKVHEPGSEYAYLTVSSVCPEPK